MADHKCDEFNLQKLYNSLSDNSRDCRAGKMNSCPILDQLVWTASL